MRHRLIHIRNAPILTPNFEKTSQSVDQSKRGAKLHGYFLSRIHCIPLLQILQVVVSHEKRYKLCVGPETFFRRFRVVFVDVTLQRSEE